MKKAFLYLVLIIIGLTVGWYGYTKYWNKSSNSRQAIFLTNGQVYFGYLSSGSSQYIHLKNVYYLKNSLPANSNSTDQSKLSLIKLGGELHGPTDEMFINRDQVLFYEDMRDDSKINDAIRKFPQNSATGGVDLGNQTP